MVRVELFDKNARFRLNNPNPVQTKRKAFPRFYFLSNDELLKILSNTRQPRLVNDYLSKCFDGIKNVNFISDSSNEIIELICDWIAAGKTYSHNAGKKFTYKDELEYVKWKLKSAKMHETTKDYVMDCFERYAEIENFDPTFTINYVIINLINNS